MVLRQPQQTKLSMTYDRKPYTVEEKKGPSVLLKRPFERQIMRNESMIHKIPDGKDKADKKPSSRENRTRRMKSVRTKSERDKRDTHQTIMDKAD